MRNNLIYKLDLPSDVFNAAENRAIVDLSSSIHPQSIIG